MPADLIIYGIIAAGLVLWLRSVLGTRHGDERQRPNPYNLQKPSDEADKIAERMIATIHSINEPDEEQITELFDSPKNNLSINSDIVKAGLLEIAKADKGFDIAKFMDASQDAFAYIVESFAEGDRETLKNLLSKNVYKAFDQAIAAREKDAHKVQTEISAFRNVEVMQAELKGKTAYITILFSADETSVTHDKDDKIIAGHPDRITEMRDLWVFSREINTRNPKWIVDETKDDLEGDNDTIPNTSKSKGKEKPKVKSTAKAKTTKPKTTKPKPKGKT